jgi:hypothetical protein
VRWLHWHLPLTPSPALKKFDEPTVNVRAIASLAGASCCSSFSSWIPSCRRRPMSETTEGFSLQGCLIFTEKVTHVGLVRSAEKYHLGSIISNKTGSVILSQTS